MKKFVLGATLAMASLLATAQTPDKVMSEAEVRKVDIAAKKITLKHGPIKNLDMPAMTMVFQVKDAAMLDKLAVGDKLLFHAEQQQGAYVVTAIEKPVAGKCSPAPDTRRTMDILAHGLWAGVGVALAQRRWRMTRPAMAATVALAVLPDIVHLVPSMLWTLFGDGSWSAVRDYAVALPGQEPAMPPWVDLAAHHLHCVLHSGVVAAVASVLLRLLLGAWWIPLLGWWSHILIDVFTHSADFYPSPVFYPFTQWGFDGLAWNTPWFQVLNYAALLLSLVWLVRTRKG